MKKNTARSLIIFAALLAAFHVVAFVVPFERTAAFWLSYIFTLLAFAVAALALWIAASGDSVRSRFYGFPIARLAVIYLAAQLALCVIFMALAAIVPPWLTVVLSALLLCAALVGLVAADSIRDEIERQDDKLKKDVSTMRALQSKAAALVDIAKDGELISALRRFSDALRYSDPVSGGALADIERELSAVVDELSRAVADEDAASAIQLARKAEATLVERNRLCKLSKGADG